MDDNKGESKVEEEEMILDCNSEIFVQDSDEELEDEIIEESFYFQMNKVSRLSDEYSGESLLTQLVDAKLLVQSEKDAKEQAERRLTSVQELLRVKTIQYNNEKDAKEKAERGLTSVQELLRVTTTQYNNEKDAKEKAEGILTTVREQLQGTTARCNYERDAKEQAERKLTEVEADLSAANSQLIVDKTEAEGILTSVREQLQRKTARCNYERDAKEQAERKLREVEADLSAANSQLIDDKGEAQRRLQSQYLSEDEAPELPCLNPSSWLAIGVLVLHCVGILVGGIEYYYPHYHKIFLCIQFHVAVIGWVLLRNTHHQSKVAAAEIVLSLLHLIWTNLELWLMVFRETIPRGVSLVGYVLMACGFVVGVAALWVIHHNNNDGEVQREAREPLIPKAWKRWF